MEKDEDRLKHKRVLMTADSVGGVWTYAIELARALGADGVDVALATMGAQLTREQRNAASRLPNAGVFESRYKLEWMQDPWTDVARAGEWLLELEQRTQPDIIHLNGYAHGALSWRAPVLIVGHSCVLSWWSAVKGQDAPAPWDRYRDEVTRGLRAARLIVAPSKAMLDALYRHYGPLREGRVIYNGIGAQPSARAAKQRFVLACGRLWDEAKNVAALEKIAHRLSWPVYVAGESNHPEGGATPRANINLIGRVSHEAMMAWYGRASIYALPACYEPFGLSALEAALSSCALVLGDIPSLREIWQDAACFVPPHDAEALRQAIENLIADDAARNALAERASRRARELTPERMLAGYRKAYSDLLNGHAMRLKEEAACAS